MLNVMRWGLVRRLRHSLVGGSAQTIEELQNNLRRRIPGLRVVGAHSPPVREVTHAGVEQDLRALDADADVLWVGLSTPKQQRWAELARQHHPAKVVATVGAAFDFHAGNKPQAPGWMQRAGLEWTFRLATEPRRLWRRYLIGNPRFVLAVLNQRLGVQ
jgi:N-acetylglucosaminyldiphosphoundecaprenol N-acetyl-beta-D-mannosaminyltransferase